MRLTTTTRELFVVLEGLSHALAKQLDQLAPLSSAAREGPMLLGVDAYYRLDTDVALLALRFDGRSMTQQKWDWIVRTTGEANLPILDPSRLSALDQQNFYHSYLRSYSIRLDDHDNPEPALSELGRLLGFEGAPSAGVAARKLREHHPSAVAPANQGVKLARMRTLRGPSEPSESPRSEAPRRRPKPPPIPGAVPEATPEYHTDRILVDLDDSTLQKPKGKNRARDRAMTVPGRPLKRAQSPKIEIETIDPLADEARPPRRAAGSEQDADREGSGARPMRDRPNQHVNVRFQRGDSWVQARLRSLTPKAALLATGAPPPVGSGIRLALGFAEHGVVLGGRVVEFLTQEQQTPSFRVEFGDIAEADRARLIALLVAARDCGLSLKPPPPRRSARIPIAWPITVRTSRGDLRAAALDLSEDGIFVATGELISDPSVPFALPLDRRGPAVTGSCRVARKVTELMARARGLECGYGVEINRVDGDGAARFQSFVRRIKRRSELHVVVAGDGKRLQALASGLAAAGYAVTRTADADQLLEQADFAMRAPDAAILDSTLGADTAAHRTLREILGRHRVPCISTRGEAPHVARSAIDRLLNVT